MPAILEFTTDIANPHLDKSLGNPVHDGVVPPARAEILGLQVDGSPVKFANEDLPDRIHKALIDGNTLEQADIPFDCYSFVLLMSGIRLVEVCNGTDYIAESRFSDNPVDLDYRSKVPLGLNVYMGWRWGMGFGHIVFPAHTVEFNQYIHKMGHGGPLCLSSLEDSLKIYEGKSAHSLESVAVKVGSQIVANWEQAT